MQQQQQQPNRETFNVKMLMLKSETLSCYRISKISQVFFCCSRQRMNRTSEKERQKFVKFCWKCLSFNWKISKVFLYHQVFSVCAHFRAFVFKSLCNMFYNASISQFVLECWLFEMDFKVFWHFGVAVIFMGRLTVTFLAPKVNSPLKWRVIVTFVMWKLQTGLNSICRLTRKIHLIK